MSPTRVFVSETQPIVVEGLCKVLSEQPDFCLCGSANSLAEALNAARELHPEILMVDHAAGLKMVFQFISDVRSACPGCQPVLWVNDLAEVDCFRALQIGARGVLRKTSPVGSLLDCLRAVRRGDIWIESSAEQHTAGFERRSAPRLTPREREIVAQVCAGLKNKEIADVLNITAGTVKVHLMHIFEKTGVKDRFELAIHARKLLGTDNTETMQAGR